jgi:DNA-binding beta-propeller fold protein YncE
MLIEQFDTLVSAQESEVGQVTDLVVSRDGNVWVADQANAHIVVIPADGGTLRTVGRKGSGPREFLRPVAIAFDGRAILVLDAGNARVQYFDSAGTATDQFGLNRGVIVPVAMNARGEIATPTLGRDSSLVLILHDRATARRHLGTPVVPPPAMLSLSNLRDQATRGEIPVEFRNNVLPILDDEGNCWLVLQTEGKVQRFDSLNRLVWERLLPEEIVSHSRADFLSKASADFGPNRVPVPQVVQSGRSQDGELWLMFSPGPDGKNSLWVLDEENGHVRRHIRLNLTGAGAFALDPDGQRIYIAIPEDGVIVSARLE